MIKKTNYKAYTGIINTALKYLLSCLSSYCRMYYGSNIMYMSFYMGMDMHNYTCMAKCNASCNIILSYIDDYCTSPPQYCVCACSLTDKIRACTNECSELWGKCEQTPRPPGEHDMEYRVLSNMQTCMSDFMFLCRTWLLRPAGLLLFCCPFFLPCCMLRHADNITIIYSA